MNYVENPIYGRKIFFLNPPFSIENTVAPALKSREYEVYIIREYGMAKPILRKFPNAICWIFIDDEMPYENWCNFIKSFEYDEELKSIFIGLLTKRAKPKDQEFFALNTQLPGGFVRLDQDIEETTKQLMGILDLNGAKGTRKCIRLELEEKSDVIAYFSSGNNLFSFQLKDISPLGFSATTTAQLAPLFKKESFIHGISFTLGRYSFSTAIQIYHTALVENNKCEVIATFTDNVSKEIIKKIHDYIYQTLELRYKDLTADLKMDNTNYNLAPTVGGNVTDEEAKENGEKSENKDDKKSEAKADDKKESEKDKKSEKHSDDKTASEEKSDDKKSAEEKPEADAEPVEEIEEVKEA